MKTNIIELVRLSDDAKEYAATKNQMNLIFGLMVTRGLGEVFHRHFVTGNTVDCNHITKTSANTLITILRGQKSEVQTLRFVEVFHSLPKSEAKVATMANAAISKSGCAARIKEDYLNKTRKLKQNAFRMNETLKEF